MSEPIITLADVIRNSIEHELNSVHTCLPAKIIDYDSSLCIASVKPLIKHRTQGGQLLSMPIIYNVPVMFPRTASSAITFPVNSGDCVLLIFSEANIDTWMMSGDESEPADTRRFDLTDAIAIPGLFASGKGKLPVNNTDLSIQLNTQRITIKESGDIEIGNGSLKALITEDFLTHTHSFSGAVAGVTCSGVTNQAIVEGCTTLRTKAV